MVVLGKFFSVGKLDELRGNEATTVKASALCCWQCRAGPLQGSPLVCSILELVDNLMSDILHTRLGRGGSILESDAWYQCWGVNASGHACGEW